MNWLTNPISKNKINIALKENNIKQELIDLFRDFLLYLYSKIKDSYVGNFLFEDEHDVYYIFTDKQIDIHFNWVLTRIVNNFKKENINFNFTDEDYFFIREFITTIFYEVESEEELNNNNKFINEIMCIKKIKTQAQLDNFIEMYNLLYKSLKINENAVNYNL